MKKRWLLLFIPLLGCLSLPLLLFLNLRSVTHSLVRRLAPFDYPDMPAELREARVIAGKEILSSRVFFKTNLLKDGIPRIADLAVGNLDTSVGSAVVIAGSRSALITDYAGNRRGRAKFQLPTKALKLGPFRLRTEVTLINVRIVDLDHDRNCEFIAEGGSDGIAAFSHTGKLLWSYGQDEPDKRAIDEWAVGDLDKDGNLEIISRRNELEAFDRTGQRKWAVPFQGVIHHLEICDTDGDGENEIVYGAGEIAIRNTRGEWLKQIETPLYFAQFELLPSLAEPKRLTALAHYEKKFWLLNFDGTVRQTFDVSFGGDIFRTKAAWIKLWPDRPVVLAVLANFAFFDRAIFYLYDQQGTLLYQEILPENCSTMAVLSQAEQGNLARLLIGGGETVWEYRLR
jgi:hypothetical protein